MDNYNYVFINLPKSQMLKKIMPVHSEETLWPEDLENTAILNERR